MKGIGRVAILAVVVGVALAASAAYADQPADRGNKSTTISTDGAIWGGSFKWSSPPVEGAVWGANAQNHPIMPPVAQRPDFAMTVRGAFNRLGSLLDGAIWGFSPPIR